MSDFMESIFDSIKIIVDKELEELAFDTTIVCRIIDDSNSKNGKYKVTDGSITFDAYSENSEYKSGESVRVTVPNNDYSQKKFIIGKYVEDETENNTPITYVSQIDSVVNISGNLIDWNNEIKATGIIMNGPESSVLVWEKDFGEDLQYLQNSGIYNTLLLKADFQTFMENYQVAEGAYGLSIELFIYVPEIGEYIRKTAIFSNSEMFGNTYSFKIPSTQSKVFPLTVTEGYIKGIKISLNQGNNFKDQNSNIITYPRDPETEETIYPQISHIQINDLQLGFGSNVTGISDNVVQIYSPNSLDYKYYLHSVATNNKKIGLVWYNKNEFDKYLGFSDGYYDSDYDEIKYLEIAKTDSRLIDQSQKENIPSDKCGLWLAADIAELDTLINKTGALITSDLNTQLDKLNNDLQEISSYEIQPTGESEQRFINTELNDLIGKLSKERVSPIQSQFILDKELYLKLLECVSKKEAYPEIEDLAAFVLPDLNRFSTEYIDDSNKEYPDDSSKPRKGFLGILNEVEDMLKNLQTNLSIHFASYLGVYDQAKIRIDRVITEIRRTLSKFPIVNILNSYPTNKIHNYKNISYQDYLLYYTYKAKLYFPADKPEQVLDTLFKREIEEGEQEANLPDYVQMNLDMYNQKYSIYWYKYNPGYQISDDYAFLGENWERLLKYDNIGRPIVDETQTSLPIMNPVFTDSGKDGIEQYMDHTMQEQRYKAILFYNHVMYTSNELVFTNADEVPNTAAIDKADGLQIEHLNNSFDSYFLYNASSNNLWDSSNANKSRQLRCHFDGLKLGDQLLYGARIYWYIPEFSMLTYNKDWLVNNQGFATDLDESETKAKSPYYRPGYVCFSKTIQETSSSEQSTGIITDESFIRDEGAGECDTRDFWYQIQNSYEPTGKTHIICMVNPKDSEIYYETKLSFSFGLMGTNGTHHTLAVINRGFCPAMRKPSDMEDDGSLKVKVELRNVNNEEINISLIDSTKNLVTVEKTFQTQKGYPVIYNAEREGSKLEDNELQLVPNKDGKPSSAIIKVSLKDYKIDDEKMVSLSTIHPIPWSAGQYYLSGTTRIVYNSLGVLDTNAKFDRVYHLYNINDDSEVGIDIKNDQGAVIGKDYLSWRVCLFDKKGNKLVEGDPLYDKYISFAPDISSQTKWVEVVINVKDIQTAINEITLEEGETQNLYITNNIYEQLNLYNQVWTNYFAWDTNANNWKFIGDPLELNDIKNSIETSFNQDLKPIKDILDDLETKLNNIENDPNETKKNRFISTEDYQTLMSYNSSWDCYFVFNPENEEPYEFIGSSNALETMKQSGSDTIVTILQKIKLKSNPVINTEAYKKLTDHNVAWSIYFEEISQDKWEFMKDNNTLQDMQNSIYIIKQVVQQKIINTNLLIPSTMYEQGLGTECFIVVEGYYEDTIYWQQPIIIIQNQHESSLLNEWSGDLVIDEENKYIMSAMLGAGYKNPDNTYNGVLMGDLAITELIDSSTRSVTSRMVGLYGFHEGAQSFGFRVDGTAFLGKAGAGRIEFNGNKGIIQSGNYIASNGQMGMQINLTDGHIDAYNFKLTSNRVIINSNSDDNAYLQIFADNEKTKTLMEVGNNSYYLQSSNYNEKSITTSWEAIDPENATSVNFGSMTYPRGMKINLQNGTIYASPGIDNKDGSYSLGLAINQSSVGGIALAAGKNFALHSNGDLKLRGNWEFWCDDEGNTGLRNDGVYSNVASVVYKEKDGILKPIFTLFDKDSTDSRWTSWDEIAGLTRSLQTIQSDIKVGNAINFAGNLMNALGNLANLAMNSMNLLLNFADILADILNITLQDDEESNGTTT